MRTLRPTVLSSLFGGAQLSGRICSAATWARVASAEVKVFFDPPSPMMTAMAWALRLGMQALLVRGQTAAAAISVPLAACARSSPAQRPGVVHAGADLAIFAHPPGTSLQGAPDRLVVTGRAMPAQRAGIKPALQARRRYR